MKETAHAPNVNAIVLALMGAVLWRKDDAQIKVRAKGTQLWVKINGSEYTVSHERKADKIKLRRLGAGSGGDQFFTNATSVTEVRKVFEAL